ncbi:hypothetical protein CRYUN_Cryun25bG0080800 [Craigia yunnanensis]
MNNEGVKPDCFTFASVLSGLASLGDLNMGWQVRGQIVKSDHGGEICVGNSLVDMEESSWVEIDICVDNALIDMYAKCGSMDSAWGVFKVMDDRSVVSWMTMIMGCAQNGQAGESLKIFDEMIVKGIKLNYITFVCFMHVAKGCLLMKWKYFSSMTIDHGISPSEDHHVYMVHLLDRAGHIKEAEELILSMPLQPGASVWQTLLSAFQVHGDIETGKGAAEHAINLDRKDPSSCVVIKHVCWIQQ